MDSHQGKFEKSALRKLFIGDSKVRVVELSILNSKPRILSHLWESKVCITWHMPLYAYCIAVHILIADYIKLCVLHNCLQLIDEENMQCVGPEDCPGENTYV